MSSIKKKYDSLPIAGKATLWFTVVNFTIKGISFFTVPVITRILPVIEYGKISLYNSYQQIFLIFSTFELYLGAYQRGLLKFKNTSREFTKSLILLCNLLTGIVFVVLYSLDNLFVKITGTNNKILILMSLFFIVVPGYNCWLNNMRFKLNYKSAVISTLITTAIITFGGLGIVLSVDLTADIYIVSTLVLEIICYLPFYISEVFEVKNVNNSILSYWKYCFDFQLPLVVHSLSYFVLMQADRIMIGKFIGEEKVAIYSVAYSLSSAISIFQISINQVFQPWRYKKLEEQKYYDLRKNTNQILVIMGIVLILFLIVVPEMMKLMFTADYFEAVWTIAPISLSVFFMLLYTIFTDVESYFYETKYIMYASIICAGVNIILNYVGLKFFDYVICGYTTLFSYIMFAVIHYCFMKKVCKKNNIDTLFETNMIIKISIYISVAAFLVTLFFNAYIIRYFMLVALCIIGVFFRKQIIEIIQKGVMEK